MHNTLTLPPDMVCFRGFFIYRTTKCRTHNTYNKKDIFKNQVVNYNIIAFTLFNKIYSLNSTRITSALKIFLTKRK